MRRIITWILVLIIGGVNPMAFLSDVNGKIRTKTIEIGDGYDGVHSPLQVNPRMASDMFNCSPDLFPSLSIKYGTQQIALMDLDLDVAYQVYAPIKPFKDTAGNIHFAFMLYKTGIMELTLERYIVKVNTKYPEKLTSRILEEGVAYYLPTYTEFNNTNFVEANARVYLNSARGSAGYQSEGYEIATSKIFTNTLAVEESKYVSPTAIYLDKMFIASGNYTQDGTVPNIYNIAFSKTGVFSDFTTAQDSGILPLHQGGKVTAIVPMRDRLFIGTETAIFALFGTSIDSFSLVLLADNIGVLNVSSCVSQNGVIYFISDDNDLYEYNGSSLLNLSREPIDTGSRSSVKGGYNKNTLRFTSMSISNNKIRLLEVENRCYLFDLLKRRWYIQETLGSWKFFNSSDTAYELVIQDIDDNGNHITRFKIFDIDSLETTNNTTISKATQGTKQIISLTIVGSIASGVPAYLTFNDRSFNRSFQYSVIGTSATAEEIAANFRLSLTNSVQEDGIYTIGGTGSTITIASNLELSNDTAIAFSVSGVGITPATYTTIQGGSAPTFASTTSQNLSSFLWQSCAFQLNPTGKQVLKAIHITYYAPIGTSLSLSTSKSIDGYDFVTETNFKNSAYKQNSRKTIFIKNATFQDWLRLRFMGTGNVIIYNITLEWRVLDRM